MTNDNTRPKSRGPRTIGTSVGDALREAAKAQGVDLPGGSRRKPRRKPQNRPQGRKPAVPVQKREKRETRPDAAAAMRRIAGSR